MISQNFIESNFPKGKLTLVVGRPSIGKTSFAISLAISMAEQNQRVIYFSLEMTKEQLIKRIRLQNEQIAIGESIVIDDISQTKPSYVRSQLETKSIDYILIDYIQLMEADNQELSREEIVSSIVCELKKLAIELDVPIIALSQTSRNGDLGIWSGILAEINVAILSRSNSYHQLIYKSYMGHNSCITHFYFDHDTTEVIDYYGDFLSFNDLLILFALNRPNIDVNINMLFEAKKNPIKHAFPHLNTILHNTYGLFVFQEQLMDIAQFIGGFSEEDSDKLRQVMGKKCTDKLDEMKPDFIRNAVKNGYTKQQANNLYQWMIDRSIYLFKRAFAEKCIKEWLEHMNSL